MHRLPVLLCRLVCAVASQLQLHCYWLQW